MAYSQYFQKTHAISYSSFSFSYRGSSLPAAVRRGGGAASCAAMAAPQRLNGQVAASTLLTKLAEMAHNLQHHND
ncbi:MAG: hypothetical protein M3Z24_05860 [Chloroflexota bacterium]|nr:hypothetical protein [Chloroflexota bacterium]